MNDVCGAEVLPGSPPGHSVRRDLAERVLEVARALGCGRAWARTAGLHVILGIGEDEAFARLTPVRGEAYGLAFRRAEWRPEKATENPWLPLLLIDELALIVEHALVGEGALGRPAHRM